jgi:ATP-binding cassette subfamily C protein CydD
MHDYYARYLPQMTLAASIPLLIVITIFPVNWAAALILLGTAPLIPLFMALVGWARPMPTDATFSLWRV